MKLFKIIVHSSVELITNSSSVIFTYSESSLSAVKELVNEMLKVFNKTETFDDIFWADVFLKRESNYKEHESFPDLSDGCEDWKTISAINTKYLKNTIENVLSKKIERPDWMTEADTTERYDYFRESTSLYLMPKDEKYSELANKLLKYLYSTDHEATRDG